MDKVKVASLYPSCEKENTTACMSCDMCPKGDLFYEVHPYLKPKEQSPAQ